MTLREELLAQADEAERLARLVSYRPDKQAMLQKAAELRRRAVTAPASRRPLKE